jgi:hypothetical protein
MERNNTTTQIVGLNVNNYEKMKEGNYTFHVGIVIWNAPSFKY